eukprot:TRINITY_DN2181_c0_g4_i1.p1 TRINITY_DN2181_c0_g4~~TRINITY_DN2181_c0_g4_i1.p1  ORF type:complete len:126 (+),score=17.06 TRINITY_DN2181_c0_g4_i1:66-443(+)
MKLLILFLFFTFVVSESVTCSNYANEGCKGDATDMTFDLDVCVTQEDYPFTSRKYTQRGEKFFVQAYTDMECTFSSGYEDFLGTTSCTYSPNWKKCYPYSSASRINSGSVFLLIGTIALFFGLNQ